MIVFISDDTGKIMFIPITVIKCSTQSYVCAQSAIEIDEGIVVLRQANFEK